MGESLLTPIKCASTQEKEYFPRNPSRSMCNGIWYGLGPEVYFMGGGIVMKGYV
jgi:hypothetical protein